MLLFKQEKAVSGTLLELDSLKDLFDLSSFWSNLKFLVWFHFVALFCFSSIIERPDCYNHNSGLHRAEHIAALEPRAAQVSPFPVLLPRQTRAQGGTRFRYQFAYACMPAVDNFAAQSNGLNLSEHIYDGELPTTATKSDRFLHRYGYQLWAFGMCCVRSRRPR